MLKEKSKGFSFLAHIVLSCHVIKRHPEYTYRYKVTGNCFANDDFFVILHTQKNKFHIYSVYSFSVLRELQRRNGLKTALGGRDEKELLPLLQFLHRNISDARFSSFLVEVVDIILDLYAFVIFYITFL